MNRPSPNRRQQLIQQWGAILWPSFIAAGLASVVFFAGALITAVIDERRVREVSRDE